jgi:hypothetical protein
VSKLGKSICEQAQIYRERWNSVDREAMYWKFDAAKLPQGGTIEATPGHPDPCHFNVLNTPDQAVNDFFDAVTLDDFTICTEDGSTRAPTAADILRLRTEKSA